jgi:hypothetical protein
MKPLNEWDEEYIANLSSGEDDRFDRKSSQALIDCAQGSDRSGFMYPAIYLPSRIQEEGF